MSPTSDNEVNARREIVAKYFADNPEASDKQAARDLGIPATSIRRHRTALGITNPYSDTYTTNRARRRRSESVPEQPRLTPVAPRTNRSRRNVAPGETVTDDERDYTSGRRTLTTISGHIHTVEDAVAFHCIDLEQWVIVRAKANSWTVTMSGGRSSTGEDTTYLNTQVSLTLEPVARPALRDSILALINRIPPLDTISAPPAVEDDADAYTMELCLFDHHFGMLSWHAETGEDYDIGVARRVYLYAVDKALAQAGQYPLARVVIPIGNDFFHMNDQAAVTPRGHNKLDTDCRLAKVFEAGEATVIEAVKRVAKLAPVEVVFVPGNHDPEMGYYLCRVLARCFERTDHVTVDASPMARKYRRFGNALIGFTHLSDEKEADLPVLMATEASADWADAVRHNAAREWHVGHIHKKRERVYTKGDSYAGVYVRHLQSLCGTDAWHFSKGYIRTLRAVESFLWHHSDALCAHFEHRIPQSMYRQARGE